MGWTEGNRETIGKIEEKSKEGKDGDRQRDGD